MKHRHGSPRIAEKYPEVQTALSKFDLADVRMNAKAAGRLGKALAESLAQVFQKLGRAELQSRAAQLSMEWAQESRSQTQLVRRHLRPSPSVTCCECVARASDGKASGLNC
eukprot:s2015_g3.t1